MKEKKMEFWCICVLVFLNVLVSSPPAFCNFLVLLWIMLPAKIRKQPGIAFPMLPFDGHNPMVKLQNIVEEIVET